MGSSSWVSILGLGMIVGIILGLLIHMGAWQNQAAESDEKAALSVIQSKINSEVNWELSSFYNIVLIISRSEAHMKIIPELAVLTIKSWKKNGCPEIWQTLHENLKSWN